MPGVPELSPLQFAARWPSYASGGEVVLLDVREHDELAIAAVDRRPAHPDARGARAPCGARPGQAARRDVPFRAAVAGVLLNF